MVVVVCSPMIDSSVRSIQIKGGRNPIAEALLEGRGQYVPNDTDLAVGLLDKPVLKG